MLSSDSDGSEGSVQENMLQAQLIFLCPNYPATYLCTLKMKDRLQLSITTDFKQRTTTDFKLSTKSKIVSIVYPLLPFRRWEPWDSPPKVQFPSSKL